MGLSLPFLSGIIVRGYVRVADLGPCLFSPRASDMATARIDVVHSFRQFVPHAPPETALCSISKECGSDCSTCPFPAFLVQAALKPKRKVNTGFQYRLALATFTFWLVDLVLNFFTGFFRQGEMILTLTESASTYSKGCFALNFATSLCNGFSLWFANVAWTQGVHTGTMHPMARALLRSEKQPTQRPANGADSSGGGWGGAFGIPEVQYIPGPGVQEEPSPWAGIRRASSSS